MRTKTLKFLLAMGLCVAQVSAGPCLRVYADDRETMSTATLQAYMQPARTAGAVVSKADDIESSGWFGQLGSLFSFLRRTEIAMYNFEIISDGPGILRDIVEQLRDYDTVVSCQLVPVEGGRDVFSIRVKTRDNERLETVFKRLTKDDARMTYIGGKRLTAAGQPDDLFCEYHNDLMLLKVNMPYTTHNFKTLLDLVARSGASIETFLFPKFDDRVARMPTVLFELRVPDAKSLKPVRRELLRSLGEGDIRGIVSSVLLHKTIADQLVEDLLDELVEANGVDLRRYETQFKQIFSLFESRMGVLRKDLRTPYIVHIIKAVKIMVNECGVHDPIAIMALMLHDSVEDEVLTHDQLRSLSFLDNIGDIVEVVLAISRKNEKEFRYEKPYLNAIVDAPQSDNRDRAILAKLADRIQNLRSLDVGDPSFHKKVFLDTLMVFLPEFVDRITFDQASPYYASIQSAIELLKCEIAYRGRYFHFIDRNGRLDVSTVKDYFTDQELFTQDDARRYPQLSLVYCCERIKGLRLYSAAVSATEEFRLAIVRDTMTNSYIMSYSDEYPLVKEFFPHRIKSSSVLFLLEWYRRYGSGHDDSKYSDMRALAALRSLAEGGVGQNEVAHLFARLLNNLMRVDRFRAKVCPLLNEQYAYIRKSDGAIYYASQIQMPCESDVLRSA